jgi:hypothetical protein
MKIVISSVFILFLTLNVQAQKEAYVIKINNDTIYGKVSIYYYQGQQIRLKKGKEKENYKAHQIKQLVSNDQVYHPIKILGRYQLALLTEQGYLSLYHYSNSEKTSVGSFNTPILVKATGELLLIENIGFKKATSKFLSDCNTTLQKFENNAYKKNDLLPIVKDYNKCITQNTNVIVGKIAEEKTEAQKLDELNAIKKSIDSSKLIQDKSDLIEMIADIKSKVKRKEDFPNYLINLFREQISKDSVLIEMFNAFLK